MRFWRKPFFGCSSSPATGRLLRLAKIRRAFEAIYAAFLGRPNGPRAGWLLASLEQEFVRTRLRDAGAIPTEAVR